MSKRDKARCMDAAQSNWEPIPPAHRYTARQALRTWGRFFLCDQHLVIFVFAVAGGYLNVVERGLAGEVLVVTFTCFKDTDQL